MQVQVTGHVPAPLAAVWPVMTVPAQMNRWSEARIEVLALGPTGQSNEAGATRRVIVPGPLGITTTLEEEIVESNAPHEMVYRVVRGGPIRNHRGQIRLVDAGGGTRVEWTVDFDAKVPATGRVIRALLRPPLARSVAAIAALF